MVIEKLRNDTSRQSGLLIVQIGVAVSLLVSFLYYRYAFSSSEKIWIFPHISSDRNIKIYIIGVLLFFSISILIAILGWVFRISRFDKIYISKYNRAFFITTLICMALLWHPLAHFNEIPVAGNLVAFILMTIVLVFISKMAYDVKDTPAGEMMVYALIIFCAAMWFLITAKTNTFYAGRTGLVLTNIKNSSAYIDTIYNVFLGKSFLGDVTEQYGHYGLIYCLPLMLIGATTKNIAILVGGVAAITYIAVMYAFCNVVKSNIFRGATGIAIAFVPIELTASTYWQFFPHRWVFPALMIAWIAYLAKRKITNRHVMLSAFFCIVAILWNWESGVISVLMLSVFCVMHSFFENQINYKSLIKKIVVYVSFVPISFMGSWLIVAIYNLFHKGDILSIQRTFFMKGFSDYVLRLETPIQWALNSAWIYKLFGMLLVFGVGLLGLFFLKELGEHFFQVLVSVAIAGLGIFTYSMNRPAAGHRTMDIFLIMGMAMLLYVVTDKINHDIDNKKVTFSSLGGVALIIFNCFMAFCFCFVFNGDANSPLRFYELQRNVCKLGAYDYNAFRKFAGVVGNEVPKDTWAAGAGTSAIYMELGWDRQSYSFSSRDEIENVDKKEIFISSIYEKLVPPGYKIKRIFEYEYDGKKYDFKYMIKD